jgi:hypothetical protein
LNHGDMDETIAAIDTITLRIHWTSGFGADVSRGASTHVESLWYA